MRRVFCAAAEFTPADTSENFFFPRTNPPGAPDTFLPGIHRKVIGISALRTQIETWALSGSNAPAPFNAGLLCGGNITYQGRLSTANAAASGSYDLRFLIPPDFVVVSNRLNN